MLTIVESGKIRLNHYKSGTRVTYFISMNSQDDFVILVKRHHQESPQTSEKIHKKRLGCFLPEAPLEGLAVSRWWLNQPIWKICSSIWIIFQVGAKMKNIWNHHLGFCCFTRISLHNRPTGGVEHDTLRNESFNSWNFFHVGRFQDFNGPPPKNPVGFTNFTVRFLYFSPHHWRARDRHSVSLLPQCPNSGHVAIVPTSPSWHRRARRRRSLARARIHGAEATGTAYKKIWKDIDLLEKHHTRPAYVTVRKLVDLGMGEWLSAKQWWGRGSGSDSYSSGYYAEGTGKGSFADKEKSSRRERQRDNKKKGQQKGTTPSGGAEPEDKAPATGAMEVGPSYAEMLKQSRLPEAKRQQAASALEEILTSNGSEERDQILQRLRALVPESSASSLTGTTSLKTKIHRVGNALGKATTKAAKQTEEIELKQRTWEKCSQAIREWASKQRRAYEKDLAKAKELLTIAQKEEQEAMQQLKELQAQLQAQGGEAEVIPAEPMEEGDESLFDTPPTLQEKDTGMTPLMKRLSLQLQEATTENEELKKQNKRIMEETQKLFLQVQQKEMQEIKQGSSLPTALTAEELQKKMDQDKARRQKQLERARATVAIEKATEGLGTDNMKERERSPRKTGDSQGSVQSVHSLNKMMWTWDCGEAQRSVSGSLTAFSMEPPWSSQVWVAAGFGTGIGPRGVLHRHWKALFWLGRRLMATTFTSYLQLREKVWRLCRHMCRSQKLGNKLLIRIESDPISWILRNWLWMRSRKMTDVFLRWICMVWRMSHVEGDGRRSEGWNRMSSYVQSGQPGRNFSCTIFPQPNWLDVTTIVVIVEFFQTGHDFDSELAILVEDMNPSSHDAAESRRPLYVTRVVQVREILRLLELAYECRPHGYRYCLAKTSTGMKAAEEDWTAYRGAYVEIHKEGLLTVPEHERDLIQGIVQFAEHLEAQQRRLQGGVTVEFRTHAVGEDGEPLGMRRMNVDMEDLLNPRQIWLWIYDLWRDHVRESEPRVYVVEPQPIQPTHSDRVVGHVLVRLDSWLTLCPVLGTVTASFQGDIIVHPVGLQAILLPTQFDVGEIFSRLGLLEFMRAWTSHHYVRQGFRELLEEHEQYETVVAGHFFVHLTLGSFSEFFQVVLSRDERYTGSLLFGTDDDMQTVSEGAQTEEEENEDVVLMQSDSVLTTRRIPVLLVGLHRTSARVDVDPNEDIIDQVEALWPFAPRTTDELHGLHMVTAPPTTGEDPNAPQAQMYIVEYTDDYFEQVHPDDKLLMVTIAFRGPDAWTHRLQKVTWGPARSSRTHILIFLRVFWFCQKPTVICWVYLNGVSWNHDTMENLQNGDHVKLDIRSDREQWTDVQYSESIERQRRVCLSSESEDEQRPEVEDLSVRSRERSRSTIRNYESDDSNLVQTYAFASRHRPVQGSANEPHWGRSHVFDRWCTQLSVVNAGTGLAVISGRANEQMPNGWETIYAYFIAIATNEFVVVFLAAVMSMIMIIKNDLCKCRRKRLNKVGRVRHQQVIRRRCGHKPLVSLMLYLVIAQHCIVTTQSLQIGMGDDKQSTEAEFFRSNFRNLPPPGNGPPHVLRLAPLLEQDDGRVDVACDQTTETSNRPITELAIDVPEKLINSVTELMHGQLRSMATSEIDYQKLHDSTKAAWIDWGPKAEITEGVTAIHIYTDGSAGLHYEDYAYSQQAAWGFGVWLQVHDSYALLAADSGHVTLDAEDPAWAGAVWGSAAEGERAALISAAVYAIRLRVTCPIHFWFDSITAGFGASGRWAHNPQHRDAVLARCVFQVLEACGAGKVNYHHVKAHQGDPYNELVNTLAYEALVHHKQRTVLDFEVRELIQGAKPLCAHWVTIYLASLGLAQFPSLDFDRLTWNRQQTRPHSEIVWQDFRQTEDVPEDLRSQSITIVSFNVRTLQTQQGDWELHTSIGAYAMLEEQLVSRQVDVVLLQETRARSSYTLRSPNYTRFVACAVDGHGGTEVWIANSAKGDHSLPLISGKNYAVQHQDSESLFIRLELPIGPILLVSAHAPHSSHDHQDVQHWWRELTTRIQRFVGDGYLILGIDANAHFATAYEDVVGTCGSERKTNYSAQLFGELLDACGCWLPSTFHQYHFGVTESWRHPGRGTWHRCDYIAISRSFILDALQSWVDGNIDAGGANVDHLAVVLRLFMIGKATKGSKGTTLGAKIDVHAMINADDDDVGDIFNELTPIDWQSNIHDHGAVFVRQLRQQLEHSFGKRRNGPKQSYISDATWSIRGERRLIRRGLYQRRHKTRTSDMGTAWAAWKGQIPIRQVLRNGRKWTLLQVLADMKDRLQLRRLGFQLRQSLRLDKEQYCQQVAEAAKRLRHSLLLWLSGNYVALVSAASVRRPISDR